VAIGGSAYGFAFDWRMANRGPRPLPAEIAFLTTDI
jgi:hypothetical protein